jgi:hypothetical protein
MYVCMCVCMRAFMHAVDLLICSLLIGGMCVRLPMYVCVYVCMHVCMCR